MTTALLAVLCFGISDVLWKPTTKIHGHQISYWYRI